jgi:Tol biopolymer transport system component/predicted Ser/Thr protein kinase
MIGETIGHYRVLEKLGEGGMGVVYKARDTRLDRFVALKFLPPEKIADPERKARFVQEAKSASALNHPNIITIYDIGENFIAMEYVAGKTLGEMIGRKGMKLSEALRCAIQVADALARAHSAGIIHRDLKPANIMVDEHGLVKVLDFGLAKLTETVAPASAGEFEPTRTIKPHTEEGTVVGTAAYMSPEQAEGKPVDARSDIFSFGAVLYEMISGQRAFRGDSRMSTLSAVLHKEPPPMGAEIPRELERIILRCLRKDPARRFHLMVDLKVELEDVRGESDSRMPAAEGPARARRRRRWLLAAAAVAVPLLAVVAWVLISKGGTPVLPPSVVPLTSYPGSELYPSFSPDGNQVAFAWDGEKQDNFDIYVKLVGTGTPLRLTTDPATDSDPAWSPDGRQIAFVRQQGDQASVQLISPLGGPERKLTDFRLTTPPSISWSPDGKWLALAEVEPRGTNGIFLIPVERGERRRLTSNSTAIDHSPAFSPDGRFLAYASCTGIYSCDVYLVELGPDLLPRGQPRRLTRQDSDIVGVAWAADGRSVLCGASLGAGVTSYLWRVPISGTVKPERLELAGPQARQPAIPRVGHRLAYVQGGRDADIWKWEAGAAAKNFISSTLIDNNAQFSPDGKRIAFSSSRSGVMEIWVCGSDGSNPVQLTNGLGRHQGTPRWSPESRWIAFDSQDEDGHWDVYVIDAAGGQSRRITPYPSDEFIPNFSRDGKWIYFSSNRGGKFEIWRIPTAGGESVQVTDRGGNVAFESGDGKTLYYTKSIGLASVPLFARSLAGGPERQVLDSVFGRAFFPVEDGIYYIERAGKDGARPLQFFDLTTGRSRVLTRIEGQLGSGFTVSPDRRTFLFTVSKPLNFDLLLVENFR